MATPGQATMTRTTRPVANNSGSLNVRGTFVQANKTRKPGNDTTNSSASHGDSASADALVESISGRPRDRDLDVVYTTNPVLLIDRHGTAPSTVSGMSSAEEHFKKFTGGQSIDLAVERLVKQ